MHCGATLLTQSAAPRRAAPRRRVASPRREAAEAAFTLTKIDTLSDQLLSSQLRFTRRIICRAVWIAPRYRNASPPTPRDIVWIFRDGIFLVKLLHLQSIFARCWYQMFLFKTASVDVVDISQMSLFLNAYGIKRINLLSVIIWQMSTYLWYNDSE